MDNTLNNTSNKFTGKERDTETGYDYFGARYYDSRIGRWLQTEPLYNKYLQFSPYQYGLLNPMILKDIDGKWIPEYNSKDNSITVKAEEGDTDEDLALQLGISMEQFNKDFESGKSSYDITKFVIPNKEYDGNAKISNCHGFVYYALYGGIENDLEPQDKNYKIFMNNLEKKLDSESPQTGEIAIFYLSKDYYVDEFKISKNDAQHTAIFIIKDRNEKKYFLNRSNTEEPVVISTTEDIIDKYKKVKPSKAPDLRENPDYFHKK